MDTKIVPDAATANVVPFRMDFLRARLAEIGKTPAALARALGLPKARAYEMQKGTRKLQPDEIGPAARFLEWTEAELVARLEGRANLSQSKHHKSDASGFHLLRQRDKPLPPLVMFRTIPTTGDRLDRFILKAERVGEVERPDFLQFSEKAFAAKILDDRNAPAYRRRDVILVDPDSPPIEGEDCIFCADPYAPAGGNSVAGCLIRSTGTCWYFRQYAVKGEHELSKTAYPNAWPIVGRYNRR